MLKVISMARTMVDDSVGRMTRRMDANLYNYDLIDSSGRISNRTEPIDNRTSQFAEKIAAQVKGWDGADGLTPTYNYSHKYGGAMPGEGNKNEYPWIGDTSKAKTWVKYKVYSTVVGYVRDKMKKMDNKFWKVTASLADGLANRYKVGMEVARNAAFPKVAGLMDMWEGPSKLESVYTVNLDGDNVPVYFQKSGEELSDDMDEVLAKHIRQTLSEDESVYHDASLIQYYNSGFDSPGGPVLTGGDVPNMCESPDKPKNWLVRSASRIYFQKGPILETRNVDVDNTIYTVRRMGKPSGWDNLSYFIPYWVAYGLFDKIGWRAAKNALGKASKEFAQTYGIHPQMRKANDAALAFSGASPRGRYIIDRKKEGGGSYRMAA